MESTEGRETRIEWRDAEDSQRQRKERTMSAQDRQERRRKQKEAAQERIRSIEAGREREVAVAEAAEKAEDDLERSQPLPPPAGTTLTSGLRIDGADPTGDLAPDLEDPAAIDFRGFSQEN